MSSEKEKEKKDNLIYWEDQEMGTQSSHDWACCFSDTAS